MLRFIGHMALRGISWMSRRSEGTLSLRLLFQEEAVSSNIWSKTLPRSFVAKSLDKVAFHLTNAELTTKH